MSELKPESENTEERLSDTEEAISQKADAESGEEADAEPAKIADIDFFYDDNGAYEARRAARMERRNKMRRRKRRMRIAGEIVVAAAAVIGIGVGFYGLPDTLLPVLPLSLYDRFPVPLLCRSLLLLQ